MSILKMSIINFQFDLDSDFSLNVSLILYAFPGEKTLIFFVV